MLQKILKTPTNPTQQILKCSQQIQCQIPLNSMEKCRFKDCQPQAQIKCQHLVKLDKYWSELLRAQQESTANYLYNIKIFGNSEDPTLEKREAVSEFDIQQRVLHLGLVGGLLKSDMFYLLSFILNLLKLPLDKQQEYMEYLQDEKLLQREIVDYLELLSRQKNAGLEAQQLKDFQRILKNLKVREKGQENPKYYNAEQIFLKTLNDINPYELEYLKNILQKPGKLSHEKFMYLAQFVDKLQAMEGPEREEYLKYFYVNKILPFSQFDTLLAFMFSKSKRLQQNKLQTLLKALFNLMDLGPCVPESEGPPKVVFKPLAIHIDYQVIDKALRHLLKEPLPNIVRVSDLRNFLRDLLFIHPEQIWENLVNLKRSNVLTPERLKFIENFIVEGKLGRVDKLKKNLLQFLISKLSSLRLSSAEAGRVLTNLVIPASKGPTVERPQMETPKVKPAEEAQNNEEKNDDKEYKEKSCKKRDKKASKKAPKKAQKKKK